MNIPRKMIMMAAAVMLAVAPGCRTPDIIRNLVTATTPVEPASEVPEVTEVTEVSSPGFRYVPSSDNITFTLPAKFTPTKFILFTLDGHVIIHGPDTHPVINSDGDAVYTLPGNGEEWAAKAVEASPRHYPSLMPFWKLTEKQMDWAGPDGIAYNNIAYRIMNPSEEYGDESRLPPGEDH